MKLDAAVVLLSSGAGPGGDAAHLCDSGSSCVCAGINALKRCAAVDQTPALDFDDPHTHKHTHTNTHLHTKAQQSLHSGDDEQHTHQSDMDQTADG